MSNPKTYVVNTSETSTDVEIEFPKEGSRKDTIFVQGRSKAFIPEGSRVTENCKLTKTFLHVKQQD